MKSFVLVSQFGISMIVPIALCMFIGIFIANQFSAPIITVPFFILGALAGGRNVYKMAKDTFQEDKQNPGNPGKFTTSDKKKE